MVGLVRHSQRKRGETDRPYLPPWRPGSTLPDRKNVRISLVPDEPAQRCQATRFLRLSTTTPDPMAFLVSFPTELYTRQICGLSTILQSIRMLWTSPCSSSPPRMPFRTSCSRRSFGTSSRTEQNTSPEPCILPPSPRMATTSTNGAHTLLVEPASVSGSILPHLAMQLDAIGLFRNASTTRK